MRIGQAAAGGARAPRAAWIRSFGPVAWVVSITVSVALLAAVAAQLNATALAEAMDRASWRVLGAALALLLGEQLLAAIRMRLIAGRSGGFGQAMRVTAWHSAWLIALPMRLGDVAWMVTMRRAYDWNAASAVACAFLQRLLDIAVVAALLLFALPAALGFDQAVAPWIAAFAIAMGALALLTAATLRFWLRFAARLLIASGGRRGWRRRLMRQLRQGRHWLEGLRHRRIMPLCLLVTAALWMAVFGAWWCVGQAFGLNVGAATFLFASAGGSLLTALPVQSIGGAGLLEAGLTGILVWFGAPAALAALVALTIRVTTWAATGAFCSVVALASVAAGNKVITSASHSGR